MKKILAIVSSVFVLAIFISVSSQKANAAYGYCPAGAFWSPQYGCTNQAVSNNGLAGMVLDGFSNTGYSSYSNCGYYCGNAYTNANQADCFYNGACQSQYFQPNFLTSPNFNFNTYGYNYYPHNTSCNNGCGTYYPTPYYGNYLYGNNSGWSIGFGIGGSF